MTFSIGKDTGLLNCTISCSLGVQGGTQGVAFHPEDHVVCSGSAQFEPVQTPEANAA